MQHMCKLHPGVCASTQREHIYIYIIFKFFDGRATYIACNWHIFVTFKPVCALNRTTVCVREEVFISTSQVIINK